MNEPVKIYSLSVHVSGADEGHGFRLGDGFVDEKCSRHADIRDHRRELLEAVIRQARSALAELEDHA